MLRLLSRIATLVILLMVCTALLNSCKSLPAGLSTSTPPRVVQDARLLVDYTGVDGKGQRHIDQQIFDEVFRLIDQAEKLIVVDMFLYNDFQGEPPEKHRALSSELTRHLIERKQAVPGLRVIVITDPINNLYGGLPAPHLDALRDAGIDVVITDLKKLRDSNPSWSGLWRLCCQWFGNNDQHGWLPNPVGPGKVTLRSYLTLINFKANHRKSLVVDEGASWTGMVMSANPHDGSSAHGNVALRFGGPAALDLLHTELAVIGFSDDSIDLTGLPVAPPATAVAPDDALIQVLTEADIRDALIAAVNSAQPGDQLQIEVFYFSHRDLLQSLLDAAERGVDLRILLDPNKDAFGREKNGIPNRQVALTLHRAGIPVRWCNTSGEQCHTKLMLLVRANGNAELILGSANFTRRNLDDFNLETDVHVQAPADHTLIRDTLGMFEKRWGNTGDVIYSLDYSAFEDDSTMRYWLYRFMEASGWSSF
ncbi:hypothetical protein S7S_05450 [Isoalcanivorax pacificus W11-5]|uniref:phospholipase D n=1 Tax=Isoalcanivorax pacificus W11-5 TaxID=391936 RepID=A0A0B4XLF7_9GAMM|nr:phospholipase D family protein [Isoalcanivorax pacificus]AJD47510.1 hypothetical protein S7S_05450 [Isoalcanivorax pacificus W11-5]